MVTVCQQPNYFPWLGYLEQCARADVLVVLDSVQWIRQGRQHRTRILPQLSQVAAKAADFQWLTLPVHGRGHRDRPLRELALDRSSGWPATHWKGIQTVYGGRPLFRTQVEPLLRPWFETEAPKFETLLDAAHSSLLLCLAAVDLKPEIAFSSELPEQGVKTERLLSLCRATNADTYYSALGATKYVDVAAFRASGIRLVWQHWKHPDYDQGRARPKTHLSFVDALANVPLAEIRRWLAPTEWGPFADSPEPRA